MDVGGKDRVAVGVVVVGVVAGGGGGGGETFSWKCKGLVLIVLYGALTLFQSILTLCNVCTCNFCVANSTQKGVNYIALERRHTKHNNKDLSGLR